MSTSCRLADDQFDMMSTSREHDVVYYEHDVDKFNILLTPYPDHQVPEHEADDEIARSEAEIQINTHHKEGKEEGQNGPKDQGMIHLFVHFAPQHTRTTHLYHARACKGAPSFPAREGSKEEESDEPLDSESSSSESGDDSEDEDKGSTNNESTVGKPGSAPATIEAGRPS